KQGDTLGRVVALRQDVVLGVKPEDDVDVTRLGLLRTERARSGNQSAREDRAQQRHCCQSLHLDIILGAQRSRPVWKVPVALIASVPRRRPVAGESARPPIAPLQTSAATDFRSPA